MDGQHQYRKDNTVMYNIIKSAPKVLKKINNFPSRPALIRRRVDDIKARVDISTVLKWYGVEYNGRGKTRCPICNSASGNGSPSFHTFDNGAAWYCFKCEAGGDVIEFVRRLENLTTQGEAMKFIESHAGTVRRGAAVKTTTAATATAPAAKIDVAAAIDRYSRAFRNSPAERYLTETRGISIFDDATGTTAGGLDRFHFGYAPDYKFKGDARIIIPSTYPEITDPKFLTAEARRLVHNKPYFKARSIRPDCEARFRVLINDGGHHATYPGNWPEELDATGESLPAPCVVVEGEIDALSIKAIDPDGKAVSMGNAHRREKFVADLLALRRLGVPIRPLWLIPDNDKNGTGVKAMAELAALLDEYKFLYCWKGDDNAPRELDLLRGTPFKDVNEFLTKDRAELTRRYINGATTATDFVKLWVK